MGKIIKFKVEEYVEQTLSCEYSIDIDKLKEEIGEEALESMLKRLKSGGDFTLQDRWDLRGALVSKGNPDSTEAINEDVIGIGPIEILDK